MRAASVVVVLAMVAAGCGSRGGRGRGGGDRDAGGPIELDAGPGVDAGPGIDGGRLPDAGMRDSGIGMGMYVQSTPAGVAFTNACMLPGAMQVLIGSVDDSSARVSLPFDFPYFGAVVPVGSQVNVCSNGWIALDGGTDSSLSGSVPSTSTPNAVIAPHWGDNYVPTGTAVCAGTTGSPGNRRFVVSWPSTHYCCSPGANLSYEVVLHEGTGIIDFVYEVMEMARAQTMGIENQTGEIGIDACGGAGSCTPTSGQRIRFTPIP